MTLRALFLLSAVLAAQEPPSPSGSYRFVHLSYGSGADKLDVKTEGGTMAFDDPRTAGLRLRFNHDASVVIGTAAEPGPRHHLLVAVRAADGLTPAVLRGAYGAAFLAIRDGKAAGLATAFAQLAADGAGKFTRVSLTGHAARIDDVNRREDRPDAAFQLAPDGTGLARFGAGSDALNGDLKIAVSPDGGLLIGWSADAILLAVRKSPEAAVFSFRGRFFVAEAFAENSFVFQKSTRFASAAGSLTSGSNGTAFLSEFIDAGGERSYLATSNQYRVGSDGLLSLAPKLTPGVDNFAFNESAFVVAHTGAPGQLTLGHGLAFGIAAPPSLPLLSSAAAPGVPDAPLSPGALMTLSGALWPVDDLRIRVNGADAAMGAVAPDWIHFQAPAKLDGAEASIEIVAGGKTIHTIRVPRAASAPALFGSEGAAKPGETIALIASGVNGSGVRVWFDGQSAEVASVTPVEGAPGRYRIAVAVPPDLAVAAGTSREVPVAVGSAESFSDLLDVVVTRNP